MKDSRKNIEQTIRNSELVSGYLDDTLTEAQKASLLAWIEEDEHNWDIFENILNEQQLNEAHALYKRFDTQSALSKVKADVSFYGSTSRDEQKVTQHSSISRFRNARQGIRLIQRSWVAVAAIILLIAAVVLTLNRDFIHNLADSQLDQHVQHDVMPGKQGATLTLASGKTITLGDAVTGELAKEAGVKISKSSDGQLVYKVSDDFLDETYQETFNTLSTAKGETYRVLLPDGSLVDLNAASSLEYPSSFKKSKQRKVRLTGEGYFEIAKDSERPFIVESLGQQATVLGTEFNITAYPDEENVITTLVSGVLNVGADGVTSELLNPGEQTVFNSSDLKKGSANIPAATAWRDGRFYFNKTPFDKMIRELTRWYNVDVEYVNNNVPKIRFSGEMKRNVSLKTVLSYLDELGVKFHLEGEKLIIG